MIENKQNNYCVIMAGGIGSRFWPYSRNAKPKQFLDFFGTGKSLLQMTVERFLPLVPMENIIIVTNKQYVDIVKEQLPELKAEQILAEPARRNTAPCIAYAVSCISNYVKRDNVQSTQDIRIVVAPSDHLIMDKEEFVRVIGDGLEFVDKNDVLLTLGMKPTRPETGYGYILRDRKQSLLKESVYPVEKFTEKPDIETAKKFVADGNYYWNSGIFIWNVEAINKALHTHLPEVAVVFDEGRPFEDCPSVSIDYGVMEKADNVYVMPADFGWSDLGTWGSLYAMSEIDEAQNVSLHSRSMFYNAKGNIVTIGKGKLAVIEGIDDMIVAENEGVLLICKKEHEQEIKQYVADVESLFKNEFN